MKELQAILKNLRAAQAGLRAQIAGGASTLTKAYADAKSAADAVEARVKALSKTAANAPAEAAAN